MSDASPPPYSPIAPYLTVDDGAAAIDFYKRAFGAEELTRSLVPGTDKILNATLMINGGIVMLSDDFPEMDGGKESSPKALGGTPVSLHLTIEDVDAAWERAVAAGATVVMPLDDMFWGSRYGNITDPFGHSWTMGTPQKAMTPEEMEKAMAEAFAS